MNQQPIRAGTPQRCLWYCRYHIGPRTGADAGKIPVIVSKYPMTHPMKYLLNIPSLGIQQYLLRKWDWDIIHYSLEGDLYLLRQCLDR